MIGDDGDSKLRECPKKSVPLPYAKYRISGENDPGAPVWEEIRHYGQPMRLEKGATFRVACPDAFYCLEKGSLREDFTSASGRQRSLLIFEQGSVINLEHAVLGLESVANYAVLADSILWHMTAANIMTIPFPCPCLAKMCLSCMAAINMTYAVGLTYLDVDDFIIRFCHYLALNIRRFGSTSFCLGLTQEECAHTLGVHRATLARAVQTLKNEGILGIFTRKTVHVLDEEKLRQYIRSCAVKS